MVKALSMDLRARAMARLAAGETTRGVAAALGISASGVSKWAARLKATGLNGDAIRIAALAAINFPALHNF